MLHQPDLYSDFKTAIRKTDIETIQALIKISNQNNYDLNQHDFASKYTLIHFAISRATLENENEMLTILKLLKNANCDIHKHAVDRLHNTPIHTACRRALPKILVWLMENEGNINIKDKTDHTPMYYVDQQLESKSQDMNESHKMRMQHIKDILVSYTERNEKRINPVTANTQRFRLFAIATVLTVGLTYAINNYSRSP